MIQFIKRLRFKEAAGVPPDWSPAPEEIHKEVYRIYIKRKLVTHSPTAS